MLKKEMRKGRYNGVRVGSEVRKCNKEGSYKWGAWEVHSGIDSEQRYGPVRGVRGLDRILELYVTQSHNRDVGCDLGCNKSLKLET